MKILPLVAAGLVTLASVSSFAGTKTDKVAAAKLTMLDNSDQVDGPDEADKADPAPKADPEQVTDKATGKADSANKESLAPHEKTKKKDSGKHALGKNDGEKHHRARKPKAEAQKSDHEKHHATDKPAHHEHEKKKAARAPKPGHDRRVARSDAPHK